MRKFTIRDLLTLTLIIGLVTGWLVDRARLSRLQKTAQELQAKAESDNGGLRDIIEMMGNELVKHGTDYMVTHNDEVLFPRSSEKEK
jgi:hypothetical protein